MAYDFQSIPRPEWPKIPPKVVKGVILGLAAITLLWGSFYQVAPEELGVILRLGKFVRSTEPGLHLKLPLGIERLTNVPVQRQLKQEFGFRTVRAGINSEYAATAETKGESLMLTGDLNVVDVEWIVQYKIKDPYLFLFKMREAEATFRDMNEAVVRRVIGDNAVDEVITVGRDPLADEAKDPSPAALRRLRGSASKSTSSSSRTSTRPNPSSPPSTTSTSPSRRKRRRSTNPGPNTTRTSPRRRARPSRRFAAPRATPRKGSTTPQGDASRFSAIYREYAKAPAVTRKRLYLETLNDSPAQDH